MVRNRVANAEEVAAVPQRNGGRPQDAAIRKRKRGVPHSELLPSPPKRAMTGYLVFTKSFRNGQLAGPHMSGREVMRAAGAQWQRLSEAEKEGFNLQAVADKQRYEREVAIWKARKAELKRPGTAYSQFVKAVWDREGARNRSMVTMGRYIATLWKGMTAAEQQIYKDRAAELETEYQARLQILLVDHRAAVGHADAEEDDEDDEEDDEEDEDEDDEDDEEDEDDD